MKAKCFARVRRALSLLLCFCLSFSLASCGRKPPTEFLQFKTEDGFYHYPGVPWGSTVDEIEAVTGWNVKDSFTQRQYYIYSDGTKGMGSICTVQDVSLDDEQCIVELQFDPEGRLWAMGFYIPTKIRDLPKRFKAFEKELIKAFGEPDEVTNYIPGESSDLPPNKYPWSRVTWRGWDEEGKLLNSCGLSFTDDSSSGREDGYLLFGATWRDEGWGTAE